MMDWEKLKTLKTSASSRATMLDILGVSRREIYITKAYEYFLNPHGGFPYYKEFAKIFFEEYGEKANGFLDEYSVQSEYVLFEGNGNEGKEKQQIDLVFFSKGKAIIVENKIDAWLYNNLRKYQKLLKDKLGLSEVSFKVLSFHSSQGMTHASICKRAKLEIIDKIQSSENQLHLFQFSEFIEHMIKLSNAMGTQEDFELYLQNIEAIEKAGKIRESAFKYFRNFLLELRTALIKEFVPEDCKVSLSDFNREKDYHWMHIYSNRNGNGIYLTIVYESYWKMKDDREILLIVEGKGDVDENRVRKFFESSNKDLDWVNSGHAEHDWKHYYIKSLKFRNDPWESDTVLMEARKIFSLIVTFNHSCSPSTSL